MGIKDCADCLNILFSDIEDTKWINTDSDKPDTLVEGLEKILFNVEKMHQKLKETYD
jgi:hypothetical protein